ncbi:MAG: hypothetical protein LUG91_03790 [Ruminococcus sp.]|nr:hypothetical protein [Ruminococcus sp.]
MAKSRRAHAVTFGFDFQVNAAIVLMLDNIEDLVSLRLEGDYEDIDVVLNDGSHILAQAKAVERSSSDFSHVRENIQKALLSLSEASRNANAKQLIFITNSPNPLNDKNSRSVFYGDARRSFDSLPPSAQKLITQYLGKIDNALDTDKLLIQVLPFETDNERERYKVVRRAIDDFIGALNLNYSGIGNKLMCIWQDEVFKNSTKKDASIILSKKDIIWPVIVIATDIERCDSTLAENFDASLYDEIVHRYHDIIDSCCERCEFFIKVLYDYKNFKPSRPQSKKCMEFAQTKWEDYVDEIGTEHIDEETQKGLIQIILYSIVRNRLEIDKIKKGVNLCS